MVGGPVLVKKKRAVPFVLKAVGHFAVANSVREVVALGWGVGQLN